MELQLRQFNDFVAMPQWRFIQDLVKDRIERYRTALETEQDVVRIKTIQGNLAFAREMLALDDAEFLFNLYETEMKEDARNISRNESRSKSA